MVLKKRFSRIKQTWRSYEHLPRLLTIWSRIRFFLKPTLIIAVIYFSVVPVYFEQESLLRVYKDITIPSGPTSINLNFSDLGTV